MTKGFATTYAGGTPALPGRRSRSNLQPGSIRRGFGAPASAQHDSNLRVALWRPRFIIAFTYESRCKGKTACCVSARSDFCPAGGGHCHGRLPLLSELRAAVPRRGRATAFRSRGVEDGRIGTVSQGAAVGRLRSFQEPCFFRAGTALSRTFGRHRSATADSGVDSQIPGNRSV